jgi:fermentation-respiration switch protein FrsA (DUF1100 family)
MHMHGIRANVLMVEYRGYGKSEGSPSEKGLQMDAEAALQYLQGRSDINTKKIFFFGRSLGGAVALHLYTNMIKQNPNRYVCSGIIVENTFTSIGDMIDVILPYIRYFKFLSRNKWRNFERVQQIPKDQPILFLSGKMDELVPPAMMQQLYDRCSSARKEIQYFPYGTHNETWQEPDYFETIERFLLKYTS